MNGQGNFGCGSPPRVGSGPPPDPIRTADGPDGSKAMPSATAIVRSRMWREMDALVGALAAKHTPRAANLLTAEGLRVAASFEATGTDAALEAVYPSEWLAYVSRVWLATVPDGAGVVLPFFALAKANVPADVLTRAAALWLRSNGMATAIEITRTSRRNIAEQVRIGIAKRETTAEIADRIRKHYRSVSDSRAAMIARTETHAAANYGSLTAASEQNEPMRKMWVATPDNLTRDTHQTANGQTQLLGSPFILEGEKLMFPGDTSSGASAELVVNCRCSMWYERVRRPASPAKPRRGRAA